MRRRAGSRSLVYLDARPLYQPPGKRVRKMTRADHASLLGHMRTIIALRKIPPPRPAREQQELRRLESLLVRAMHDVFLLPAIVGPKIVAVLHATKSGVEVHVHDVSPEELFGKPE